MLNSILRLKIVFKLEDMSFLYVQLKHFMKQCSELTLLGFPVHSYVDDNRASKRVPKNHCYIGDRSGVCMSTVRGISDSLNWHL